MFVVLVTPTGEEGNTPEVFGPFTTEELAFEWQSLYFKDYKFDIQIVGLNHVTTHWKVAPAPKTKF